MQSQKTEKNSFEITDLGLRSRHSKNAAAEHSPIALHEFSSNKLRLTYGLRALFNIESALLPVAQSLASDRSFISNIGIHLPEASRAMRGVLAKKWYEAAATHCAAHVAFSTERYQRGSLKPIQISLLGVLEDARVEALAIDSMPGLRRLWSDFHDVDIDSGHTFEVLQMRLAKGLLVPEYVDPHPWVFKGRSMFKESYKDLKSPGESCVAALRNMASILGNDIGQMRLQFNDREYLVQPSYRDNNQFIWELKDQDNDKNQLDVNIRLSSNAQSEHGNGQKEQSGPAFEKSTKVVEEPQNNQPSTTNQYQYDEWDRLIGGYRDDWCTILEPQANSFGRHATDPYLKENGRLLSQLRRVLHLGTTNERIRLRARVHGDVLDTDAALGATIDRRARRDPSQKIYQQYKRRERDIAALMLLDSSQSTADICASDGRSVLDLARESALLTALTLCDVGDTCAIHSFSSNGRKKNHYEVAMEFSKSVSPAAIQRLAGVRSRLSTRMGAALRHATMQLLARRCRQRLLVFITDGKPTDIDIYDSRYLIDDARCAVREAKRKGVVVFCVSLDPSADKYVRHIFGSKNYRVLDQIESLPRLLPQMILRMTA